MKSRALSHDFPYRSAFSFNLCLGYLSETITSVAFSNIRIIFIEFFYLLLL